MENPGAATVVVIGSYAPSLIIFRGPLISELVARGYRVVAVAPEISPEIKMGLQSIGAQSLEIPIVNSSLNPFATFASYRALKRKLKQIAPKCVLSYTIKPVTIGSLAAFGAGVPRIIALITGLGFAFTEGRGLKRMVSRIIASRLYRLALRRCTAILFQNRDDREQFRALGLVPKDSQVTVVNGSGIDLLRFAPAPLPNKPIFLMISRLLGDKGVREYGQAANSLKRKYRDARFQLVGYFDQSPDSISQAELDVMIANGIEFLGRMDDVRPAIAGCSVYVLPSYREGTPRSVLEAMAMGRPIVTTDAPGCRETVEDGQNGWLVPPRAAESLAAAMERFIIDPASIPVMGARSRSVAECKYDVHSVNAAILEASGL